MPKSTTYQAVRHGTAPAPLRWTLGATQAVAPGLAAWFSERLFFTPPRRPLPTEADALLKSARRFTLWVEGRRVEGWRWEPSSRGNSPDDPVVYLLHGWGGQGGRLGAFVSPLLDAGLSVVAFDAPGHGASGRGMSSMPEYARALRAVTSVYGPPHAVIAHSLGAAATGLAVHWGLRPRRLVFLAPPADPGSYVAPFAQALGLRADVVNRLKARSERRIRFRWSDLDVRRMAPSGSLPLLVVHDREDPTVPFAEGTAIADTWDGHLYQTNGLGHSAILRDPAVVAEVVAFVAEPASQLGPPPSDSGARLEWALFHRDVRW
jgi:pimeloyl-ACP methyl ester carboxylesterase